MMREAKLFATLACALTVGALAAGGPARAAVLSAGGGEAMPALSGAMPVAFSFTHAAPSGHAVQRPLRVARPAPGQGWQPRWFGYPSAQADEMPPPAPPPSMLFSHAALGVAALDSSADRGADAVTVADGGHLSPAELRLQVPAAPGSNFPAPLPTALILALVLLPAGLVLAQVLRGPPRRTLVAMRRPAPRRDDRG